MMYDLYIYIDIHIHIHILHIKALESNFSISTVYDVYDCIKVQDFPEYKRFLLNS